MRAPALSGFAALVAALVLSIVPAKSQSDPSGVWLTQAGDARIQVSRCGGGICARIVWLREPIDPKTGRPQIDDKNPNPSLARRPIIGLSILSGMRAAGPNKWSGRIYNADDGQSYATTFTLQSESSLEVQGCAGVFCGSETWTKYARAAPAAKRTKSPAQ